MAKAVELKIDLTRDGVARQVILPIDGAPAAETSTAFDRGPGPQRTRTPQPGSPLGGGSEAPPPEASDEDAY